MTECLSVWGRGGKTNRRRYSMLSLCREGYKVTIYAILQTKDQTYNNAYPGVRDISQILVWACVASCCWSAAATAVLLEFPRNSSLFSSGVNRILKTMLKLIWPVSFRLNWNSACVNKSSSYPYWTLRSAIKKPVKEPKRVQIVSLELLGFNSTWGSSSGTSRHHLASPIWKPKLKPINQLKYRQRLLASENRRESEPNYAIMIVAIRLNLAIPKSLEILESNRHSGIEPSPIAVLQELILHDFPTKFTQSHQSKSPKIQGINPKWSPNSYQFPRLTSHSIPGNSSQIVLTYIDPPNQYHFQFPRNFTQCFLMLQANFPAIHPYF